MAKQVKKHKKKPVNTIAVKGSFLDIMKAAGKQANNKSTKKQT